MTAVSNPVDVSISVQETSNPKIDDRSEAPIYGRFSIKCLVGVVINH